MEQYATSDVVENNWMTRQLTTQLEGLMTEIERTMEHFERYFHWMYHVDPPNQEACREQLLQGGSNTNASRNKKDKPQEGLEA
eukprot:8370145-Ditylum_brightwellii.AAC.1